MFFLEEANSVWMNIVILAFILVFVIFMPLIDIKICNRLGLNLMHGISSNENADRLLKIRRIILHIIFAIYIVANAYIVLLSREPYTESIVNDGGVSAILKEALQSNFSAIGSTAIISNDNDITQSLMNIALYVPLGYLLPYIFDWFRTKLHRPILCCFICSFATENLQLLTRRGMYDLDDLIFNTIGGLIGVGYFVLFAYVVTHPHWRRERKHRESWKKTAKNKTLSSFGRTLYADRVTINATIEEDIYDFYMQKLGFDVIGQYVSLEDDSTSILAYYSKIRVEFICSNKKEELPPQTLYLAIKNPDHLRKKLIQNGLEPSEYFPDKVTKRKSMSIEGPDNVTIIFVEC